MDYVDRLYGFLEALKERAYQPGEDSVADSLLLPALAELSRRPDLRDAVLCKAISPSMDGLMFRQVATRLDHHGMEERSRVDAAALAFVGELIGKAWDSPAYDTKQIVQRTYHQDLPKLFDRLASRIVPSRDQSGVRAVGAYVSWLQGDDGALFRGYLDALARVREHDPWAEKLEAAYAAGAYPAWLERETAEMERAGAVNAATFMDDAPSPVLRSV